MQTFNALLHIDQSKVNLQTKLSLLDDCLEITDDRGGKVRLLYSDLELKTVGYMDCQTILKVKSNGDTIISPDMKLLKALRAKATGELQEQISNRLNKSHREIVSLSTSWFAVALIVICLIATALYVTTLVIDLAVAHIPIDIENKGGQMLYLSYAASHKILDKSPLGQHINRIGLNLVQSLPSRDFQFQFHLEDNPSLNAFAMPGGNIVIYSALAKVLTDDELADVLAHEMGHIIKRHSLRKVLRDAGFWACLKLIFHVHSGQVQELLKQFFRIEGLNFSRSQEEEADRLAVHIASQAGYDPHAFIAVFKRLQKTSPDNKFLSILSDHPMSSDREKSVLKEIELIKNK